MSEENNGTVVENTEPTTWNNVTNGVSLSDYSEQETTESQTEEPLEAETSNEPVTEADNEEGSADDYVLNIDGKEFGIDEVLNWKQEADNKSEWTKSNTQKSQNLARMKNVTDELVNNKDLQDVVKNFYSNDQEKLNKFGLDELSSLDVDTPAVPESNETDNIEDTANDLVEAKLDKLTGEMRELAIERRIKEYEGQLQELETNFPDMLGEEKTIEFLEFAKTNDERNLLRAFKEWSFPQMADRLRHNSKLDENKQRNQGKVINTSNAGMKGVASKSKVSDWKDVNMSNPEIKKYFER